MFCKKDALKDFANFPEKHLYWSLFIIKLQASRPALLLKGNSTIVEFLRVPVPSSANDCFCYLHTSQKLSILGFTKYCLTSSALQTLVPPNLYLLLRLSYLINIANVWYSNSLNRLNA